MLSMNKTFLKRHHLLLIVLALAAAFSIAGIIEQMIADLPAGKTTGEVTAVTVNGTPGYVVDYEAAISGDPELVVAACALDPLTAGILSLKEIRDMAAEMLEAEREWLPQFIGASINPTPIIATPPGTIHAEVPLDPALAVANRFGELANKASH